MTNAQAAIQAATILATHENTNMTRVSDILDAAQDFKDWLDIQDAAIAEGAS